MPAQPAPLEPTPAERDASPAEAWPTRAKRYAALLDSIIGSAEAISVSLKQDICAPEASLARADKTALSTAFDQNALTIRRSILLAEKLTHAPPPRAPCVGEARERVVREVEDTIQRETTGERAEFLSAELQERVEMPEFVEHLENRPIEDLIRDIRRDLGLTAPLGAHPWKRRRPADIALLHARAHQQPSPPIRSSA